MGGRTVTVKIKYADFEQLLAAERCPAPRQRVELAGVGRDLVASVFPLRKPVRLLGISMSNFEFAVRRKALRRRSSFDSQARLMGSGWSGRDATLRNP